MTSIKLQAASFLPTRFGNFRMQAFTDEKGTEHLALIAGHPVNGSLVRLHSECATGDALGSMRCDCRDQLELALTKITEEGQGIFVYIRGHEGRGIGLANKVKAYALQDTGMDTVEANVSLGFAPDQRDYSAAIEILRHFGLSWVRLLTNNRRKIEALQKSGIEVVEHIPLWAASNPHNQRYIDTKKNRLGHIEPAKVINFDERKTA